MTALTVRSGSLLQGEVRLPGDKSLSHRALILGALAGGTSHIEGWLDSGDTRATLAAIQMLGVSVERNGGSRFALGGGELRGPDRVIDCANAGTSMRLLAGLLAGQPFDSTLDGHPQLRKRPMGRVTEPLRQMGAQIEDENGRAPLVITGALLRGGVHQLNVASAQVKSALLLAGLQAQGPTTVIEPGPSRDHTERLLVAMGAELAINGHVIRLLNPGMDLAPLDLTIPGDFSSAAFLIVAASIVRGSEVRLRSVGLNPTRTGLLDIMARMGADIVIQGLAEESGEPVGGLRVRAGGLAGTVVKGDEVVRAIDELPVLAVAATQAEGVTTVRDAAELRVKEVDRISSLVGELRKLGAQIDERPDGFVVEGGHPLRGAEVDSQGDHRLGMALAVAGLVAEGETVIDNADCIADSYPAFAATLVKLGAQVT